MRVAVFGANGRVGKRVVEILKKRNHTTFEVDINTDIQSLVCDVVIDFSDPSAIDSIVFVCKKNNAPLVSGTTGLSPSDFQKLQELSECVIVDYRQNFSTGVSAMKKIVKDLKHLLPDWDAEIVEVHRKEKKDSPSGTALALAAELTAAENRKNKKAFQNTTIHSLRMGSVFGTHTVVFAHDGETLTLTHNAENVDIFAYGAVESAEKIWDSLNFSS